jgi:hypothetical protein
MGEPTEADRERAAHIVANWTVNFSPDQPDALENMISTYLADERERATEAERLTWNPMIGRMLQVTQEWARLGGVLAVAAEQFHAAIAAAEETGQ